MFTNILFLILALLMSGLAPDEPYYGIIETPTDAFLAGIAVWVSTLLLFYLQKRFVPKARATLIASLELLSALALYHFLFNSQKIFYGMPEIIPSAVSLSLWIFGIGFFQWCYGGFKAFKQQTLFLAPFAIPYVIITIIMDTFSFIDDWLILLAIGLATIIAIMIFLPYFFQLIWQCNPINNNELHDRLEALCSKADFKHAGMKTWTIFNDAHTAAIIGIVPNYRYVMFTQRILDTFKPEWLEAILAHEIGHSKNKHLLLYPFITFGMIIVATFLTTLAIDPIIDFFNTLEITYPWPYWSELTFFTLFALFGAIIVLGFRLLFGYFSRLFERQADLYIFNLGIDASCMTDALNEIGTLTGDTHNKPNWHHYSIRQRIDFINNASISPALIANHNRKVRTSLYVYFTILTLIAVGFLI